MSINLAHFIFHPHSFVVFAHFPAKGKIHKKMEVNNRVSQKVGTSWCKSSFFHQFFLQTFAPKCPTMHDDDMIHSNWFCLAKILCPIFSLNFSKSVNLLFLHQTKNEKWLSSEFSNVWLQTSQNVRSANRPTKIVIFPREIKKKCSFSPSLDMTLFMSRVLRSVLSDFRGHFLTILFKNTQKKFQQELEIMTCLKCGLRLEANKFQLEDDGQRVYLWACPNAITQVFFFYI